MYLREGVKLFVIEETSEFELRTNIDPFSNNDFHIKCLFFRFQDSNAQIWQKLVRTRYLNLNSLIYLDRRAHCLP
jgi:hypothetical protein